MTFYKNRDIILRQKILNIGNVLFPWEVTIMNIKTELWEQVQILCEMDLSKKDENSLTLSMLPIKNLTKGSENEWEIALNKLFNTSLKETWNFILHQVNDTDINSITFSNIRKDMVIPTLVPHIETSVIRLDVSKDLKWIIVLY